MALEQGSPSRPSGRVLELPADEYHGDEGHDLGPTLSASMINLLLAKSPRHAWHAHPRLNPAWQRRDDAKFDIGSAVHDVFLEGRQKVDIVDAKDWRKDEAKAAREAIRAAGRIPLLQGQWEQVLEMIEAIHAQLRDRSDERALFTGGKAEQAIVWDEDGVACRARLDYLDDAHLLISDLKTTKASAAPDAWSRTGWAIGVDVQACFYMRAVSALHPERFVPPAFRYCVVECEPPYAMSVFDLAPSAIELGNAKIDRALEVWSRCLRSGSWPAYDRRVASIEAPGWAQFQWAEHELDREVAV